MIGFYGKNMKKISALIAVVFSVSFLSPVYAVELTGDAYGNSREESKKQALAALSESILVEMNSVFESEQHSDGYQDAKKLVKTKSELPLLGVDVTFFNKQGGIFCTAFMNSDKSLKLYQAELTKLSNSVASLNKKQLSLKKKPSQRYSVLNELLTSQEQFNKYLTVAMLLGGQGLPKIPLTEAAVKSELISIESTAPSLAVAANVLTRDLANHIYYVEPALPEGSQTATKLSRLLKNQIEAKVKSSVNRNTATHLLKGSYEILQGGISVSYKMINREGATLASRVVKLAPAAYKKIAYKPTSINFDKLLHQGYVVSNDFKAELNSNQGKSNLLFSPGQTIELFAKLNSPGYFYVVSHNTTDGISYLLELNDTKGKRAFVKFVNADDANRWVSLGEFEVTPPYGSENLQLIASNIDLVNRLPGVAFDAETELYIVQTNSVENAVMKTRGLKPKKKKKVRSSEATLTFTTMVN